MRKLIDELNDFRDERNWKQFHTPENLAKSIVIESAELLENFQFGGDGDIDNIKEEVADIYAYLLMFADHYDFDLNKITYEKIEKNKEKYPISKSYGKSDKYNKL